MYCQTSHCQPAAGGRWQNLTLAHFAKFRPMACHASRRMHHACGSRPRYRCARENVSVGASSNQDRTKTAPRPNQNRCCPHLCAKSWHRGSVRRHPKTTEGLRNPKEQATGLKNSWVEKCFNPLWGCFWLALGWGRFCGRLPTSHK